MPLIISQIGMKVEVVNLVFGAEIKRRLENMGFAIGRNITPLARRMGNMIIVSGNARIAISEAVASKILVKQID